MQHIVLQEQRALSLEETKEFLRVLHNDDDEYISSLIQVAYEQLQQRVNTSVDFTTYEVDTTFKTCIKLNSPLVKLLEVKVDDIDVIPKIVKQKYTYLHFEKSTAKKVYIKYQAGYETLPHSLKQWLKCKIMELYDLQEFKSDYDALIESYRIRPV